MEYETGARLRAALGCLSDAFLLLYCDNYCPVDYQRLVKTFFRSGASLCLSAYANRDGYTRSNLLAAPDGRVLVYDKQRQTPGLSGVDIGYALVRREAVERMPAQNGNFEALVYPTLAREGKLYAAFYRAPVLFHRFLGAHCPCARVLLAAQVCLPGQDGTLNERAPRAQYITTPEAFIWLPGARQAVRKLKEAGYTVLLFTNQPGVARGAMTEADLAAVHEKMRRELQQAGADIDGIYCCTHGWDEGCPCRKPKPGLLYQAQRDWSFDLTHAVVFGDDARDEAAAHAAGCRFEGVSPQRPLLRAVEDYLEGKA